METLAAIFSRRSVRTFIDQPIEKEKTETLLKAAMNAPSAGNEQPWYFIVVDKRNLLDKIAEVHPYTQMCKQAPLAILVCADPALEKHKGFWSQDAAAATENILLAARDIGLGAVWCGVYPRADRIQPLQQLFNIPANIIPFNVIALGYSEVKQESVSRYDAARIHHNGW